MTRTAVVDRTLPMQPAYLPSEESVARVHRRQVMEQVTRVRVQAVELGA